MSAGSVRVLLGCYVFTFVVVRLWMSVVLFCARVPVASDRGYFFTLTHTYINVHSVHCKLVEVGLGQIIFYFFFEHSIFYVWFLYILNRALGSNNIFIPRNTRAEYFPLI